MITQGPIVVNSHCPHHLYSVKYVCFVSYLPKGGNVLGLSKLARICEILANRPVLQEQLAHDIANVLYKNKASRFSSIDSMGSAVMLVGTHLCMSCRGVRSMARTTVTEIRGAFWDEGMEFKFQQAVNAAKTINPFGD
jgi:GTP cyclohydrolase I